MRTKITDSRKPRIFTPFYTILKIIHNNVANRRQKNSIPYYENVFNKKTKKERKFF